MLRRSRRRNCTFLSSARASVRVLFGRGRSFALRHRIVGLDRCFGLSNSRNAERAFEQGAPSAHSLLGGFIPSNRPLLDQDLRPSHEKQPFLASIPAWRAKVNDDSAFSAGRSDRLIEGAQPSFPPSGFGQDSTGRAPASQFSTIAAGITGSPFGIASARSARARSAAKPSTYKTTPFSHAASVLGAPPALGVESIRTPRIAVTKLRRTARDRALGLWSHLPPLDCCFKPGSECYHEQPR